MSPNLQANSNAAKKSLKDLVKKYGSLKKYVSVEVHTKQEATEENMDKLQGAIESEVDKLNGS